MKGYLRVAAIMPNVKVGNVKFNLESIKEDVLKVKNLGVKVCVFPELCLTGNNLQSLYLNKTLLNEVAVALMDLVNFSMDIDILMIVSLPFEYNNLVCEVAVVVKSGKILGMIPKKFVNKKELNYKYFDTLDNIDDEIEIYDANRSISYTFPFSDKILFQTRNWDLSVIFNENFKNCLNTSIYANISSIPEVIDIDKTIKYIKEKSEELNVVIVTATPGPMESSSNYVYFGRSIIAENGELINKNEILSNHILISDVDLDKIPTKCENSDGTKKIITVKFDYSNLVVSSVKSKLYRDFDKTPYINKKINPYSYSKHIINILAIGLVKRLTAIGSNEIVVGISGGLDSTMALIIIKKTIEFLSLSEDNIHAYSLPCFGTTNNSNNNLTDLLNSLDIKLNEINIEDAVSLHLDSIGHSLNDTNVTFENAQARERMQILMDIANDLNGIVVGTSDLSEIALGFSTYNGDHMSMYNVNGALPKTLLKYILNAIADENIKNNNNMLLAEALKNILNSPISPELLPTENGKLMQKTEEILGNYEIHDFILYNYLKYNYGIDKIYDLALRTFVYNSNDNTYTDDYIRECINIFFDKFFKAQYKRSTAPDYPFIGLPCLNMNYNFSMPNDIEAKFGIYG